ncbi:MAG: ABC transporter substrate-binding protein [Oligoflexia bacterium]|nr:ABC transporter substrate-binding protein [Oligoflexia bacterium]
MRVLKLFFISLCFISTLTACTGNKDDFTKKSLTLALGDDAKSLDPAIAYDTVSLTVVPLAMESLFQYKYTKTPLELEPLLAEAMPTISADKKTYTIKIKKGVMWQDDAAFTNGKGRELKANDFLYGWKRLLIPEIQSPGTWIFDDKVVGWNEYRKKLSDNRTKLEEILAENPEGLKAVDDYTIQIKLIKPYPQLLNALAMGFGAPVAKEVTDKYGHQGLTERMVGTGPYILKTFVKGSRIELGKNPNFRKDFYPTEGDDEAKAEGLLASAGKELPLVSDITFLIIKESQPAWLQFLKGNLDAAGIPKDNFDSAIKDKELDPSLAAKGINLRKGEEAVIWYLNFNMKDKIVGGNNIDLRRAISMAINREEFIEKFLNGRGVKATSIVPRVINGFSGRTETVNDYNPEESKKLLAKAGYPEGKGLPVIKYDLRGASSTSRQQAEWMQKSLSEVGIKIEVVANTFPAYLEKEKNGHLQFFMGGWSADYPDAENFLFLLYSKNEAPGPNATIYKNPAYDKLYEKIAIMTPSKERSQLIKEAEDIVFKDAAWGMMWYPLTFALRHGWLQNYRPNSQILNDIKYYDVDLEKKKVLKPSL